MANLNGSKHLMLQERAGQNGQGDSLQRDEVLVIGSGSMLVSLASQLCEYGFNKFHVLVTDIRSVDRLRVRKFLAKARKMESKVTWEEASTHTAAHDDWRRIIQSFRWILYVSETGNIGELKQLYEVCKEEGKILVPGLCIGRTGIAGPLVHPAPAGSWESAWRRIHRSAVLSHVSRTERLGSAAASLLTNVIASNLLSAIKNHTVVPLENTFYLLNLESFEGEYVPFLPHPMITGIPEVKPVDVVALLREECTAGREQESLLSYFARLTSPVAGIFRVWGEGELQQLPLSQCRVQVMDPLSRGPAEPLPDLICGGLTHAEARRKTGLAGMELYASRIMSGMLRENFSIGAGETFTEGILRGLRSCITEELGYRAQSPESSVKLMNLQEIEDRQCKFYWQTLTIVQGAPMIGIGEEVLGFPVLWLRTAGSWYAAAGLTITSAMRELLEYALLEAQNETFSIANGQVCKGLSVIPEDVKAPDVVIPSMEGMPDAEILKSCLKALEANGKRLTVFDLSLEPFIQESPVKVVGVQLQEAVSS